jgi:membrane carboxypeptidase/penicillin-binding protein
VQHHRYPSLFFSYVLTDYEKTVLLLEDRRFFLHNGIDTRCVPRALRRLLRHGRLGGVSTIEQQLVRTILNYRERTLRRKAQEVFLAMALSYRESKTDLLRAYLNMAYHGYGLVGCDNAALLLFGKVAVALDREEGALIASLLVYPLPKQIREDPGMIGTLPAASATDFLDASGRVAPNWTRNVRRRSAYGLALLRKAEKSA